MNVVTLFVEGETEKEFFRKLFEYLEEEEGRKPRCEIKYRNLKGVGNYKNKAPSKFREEIFSKFPKAYHCVALCYDSDAIDRGEVKAEDFLEAEKKLYIAGANRVMHVIARESIEDWFLIDKEGLKRYLGAPKNLNISIYKGQDGLTKICKRFNKPYRKGESCSDLIDALDLSVIIQRIKPEIGALIETVFRE